MVHFASDDHSLDHSYASTYVHDHDMDFGSVLTGRTSRSLLSTSTFVSTASKDKLAQSPSNVSLEAEFFEVDVATYLESVKNPEDEKMALALKQERRSRIFRYLCLGFFILLVSSLVGVLVFYLVQGTGVSGSVSNAAIAQDSQGLEEIPLSEAAYYVLDILDNHTSKEILLDSSTYQGKIFLDLVAEEEDATEPTPDIQVVQRYALLALYHTAAGEGWGIQLGWKSRWKNVCKWYGIESCTERSAGEVAVNKIDLASNGLIGFIPEEFCLIGENLDFLDLSGNNLTGTIPACVSRFYKMENFILRSNEFTGGLPPGFLTIPTLQYADFSSNKLTGPLDVLFQSGSSTTSANTVYMFSANENLLTGEIPVEFGNFSAILRFAQNNLTGYLGNSFCSNGAVEVDCPKVNCSCCLQCD